MTASKLLPLPIPGTNYLVEPTGNNYVIDLDKTWLQILYEDSTCLRLPPVLPSAPVRRLWEPLKAGEPDPNLFYDKELHEPYGIKTAEGLLPTLKQLTEEMYNHFLFVKGAFVTDNKERLVLNLGDTPLPAFIEPEIYTATPVKPKSEHGMTLEEFEEAGGRIVAHGSFPAGQYQLENCEWTEIPKPIEPLGVMPGDEIYANLNSEVVMALGWDLCRPGERPSPLYAAIGLDDWDLDRGVLRGRKRNAATSQETLGEIASQLEKTAKQLRSL